MTPPLPLPPLKILRVDKHCTKVEHPCLWLVDRLVDVCTGSDMFPDGSVLPVTLHKGTSSASSAEDFEDFNCSVWILMEFSKIRPGKYWATPSTKLRTAYLHNYEYGCSRHAQGRLAGLFCPLLYSEGKILCYFGVNRTCLGLA